MLKTPIRCLIFCILFFSFIHPVHAAAPLKPAAQKPTPLKSTPPTAPSVKPPPVKPRKNFRFPFTGRIYTDQYLYTQPRTLSPTNNNSNTTSIAQSSYSLWLEADSNASAAKQGLGARAVGQIDLFYRSQNEPTDTSIEYRLREGFVSYTSDSLDIKAGQQIIPWGKSDGVNPTDYFTAKNYTLLTPDDEVRRLGAPSFNFGYSPDGGASPINFQAVFQAFYPQTRLLIPDQAVPQGVAFTKYPKPPTAFQTDSVEYGFKLSYLASDFDLSVSYFEGFNHFAEYVLVQQSQTITPVNFKQRAVGGDASFAAGDYVFRLESAFLMPENGSDADPLFGLVEPYHWDSVIGVERPIADDFRTQVQLLIRHHLYYQDPSTYVSPFSQLTQTQRTVGRANAMILNYQQQTNIGATFRFGFAKPESDWTADIFLIGYFANGQDYVIRPQITYKPIDNTRLMIGADYYGGDESRPLGALTNQSTVFFEARYLF